MSNGKSEKTKISIAFAISIIALLMFSTAAAAPTLTVTSPSQTAVFGDVQWTPSQINGITIYPDGYLGENAGYRFYRGKDPMGNDGVFRINSNDPKDEMSFASGSIGASNLQSALDSKSFHDIKVSGSSYVLPNDNLLSGEISTDYPKVQKQVVAANDYKPTPGISYADASKTTAVSPGMVTPEKKELTVGNGGQTAYSDIPWTQEQINGITIYENGYLGRSSDGYEFYRGKGPTGDGIFRVNKNNPSDEVSFAPVADVSKFSQDDLGPLLASSAFQDIEIQDSSSGVWADDNLVASDLGAYGRSSDTLLSGLERAKAYSAVAKPTTTPATQTVPFKGIAELSKGQQIVIAGKTYTVESVDQTTNTVQVKDENGRIATVDLAQLTASGVKIELPVKPAAAGATGTPGAAGTVAVGEQKKTLEQFSSENPDLRGDDLKNAYNAYLSTLPSSVSDIANQKSYVLREVISNGKIIGYAIRGKFFSASEKEQALEYQKKVWMEEQLKGLTVVGEKDGKYYVFDKKDNSYYLVEPDFTNRDNPTKKSKVPAGSSIILTEDINGVKINVQYKLGENGQKSFENIQLAGYTVSDQFSSTYLKNALKSAGGNAKVENTQDGFSVYTADNRKVFDYGQKGTAESMTMYDAAGREKRSLTRDGKGDSRQTTKETLYTIKLEIDKSSKEVTGYFATGTTYTFSYDDKGKYAGRTENSFRYIISTKDGAKVYDYTVPVKNGVLDLSGIKDENIKKDVQAKYSQTVWRARFATIDYAFNTFSGLGFYSSLLMSDEDLNAWRENVDEMFNNVILGGPRYWVSEICKNQYDMSSDSIAYSEGADNILIPSAHVEAEKSDKVPIPYGTNTLQGGRLYKMSFSVKATFKNVVFNVYLIGPSKTTKFFNSDVTIEGDDSSGNGEQYVFNCKTNTKCAQYSFNEYNKICIKFEDKGDLNKDEVCNVIVQSDYSYNNYVNSNSDVYAPEAGGAAEETPEDSKKQNPVQI